MITEQIANAIIEDMVDLPLHPKQSMSGSGFARISFPFRTSTGGRPGREESLFNRIWLGVPTRHKVEYGGRFISPEAFEMIKKHYHE